jgi:hypothetical protein
VELGDFDEHPEEWECTKKRRDIMIWPYMAMT